MIAAGRKQREVAEAIGVSKAAVSVWVNHNDSFRALVRAEQDRLEKIERAAEAAEAATNGETVDRHTRRLNTAYEGWREGVEYLRAAVAAGGEEASKAAAALARLLPPPRGSDEPQLAIMRDMLDRLPPDAREEFAARLEALEAVG